MPNPEREKTPPDLDLTWGPESPVKRQDISCEQVGTESSEQPLDMTFRKKRPVPSSQDIFLDQDISSINASPLKRKSVEFENNVESLDRTWTPDIECLNKTWAPDIECLNEISPEKSLKLGRLKIIFSTINIQILN